MGQRFPRMRIRNRELTNWSDPMSLWFLTRYLAEQGSGFHPAVSACFLKLVLVTNGSIK